MKRYFIEIISKSTENNTNFPGVTMRYVYGKKEKMVARQAITDPVGYGKYDREYDNTTCKWCLEDYGFKTRGVAQKVAKQVHINQEDPFNLKYWTDEVKIIEAEVEEG